MSAPDTRCVPPPPRDLPQADASALSCREWEGISGLLAAPLNLPPPEGAGAGRNKRPRRGARDARPADAGGPAAADVAALQQSISGGWLLESMEFRSAESRGAVVQGLYDVATTSVRPRPAAPPAILAASRS